MRAKTHEFNRKMFTEIPGEIVKALGITAGDEVEFFPAHGNIVVVSPVDKAQREEKTGGVKPWAGEAKEVKPAEKELSVLKKINFIKHGDRTPENVVKKLSGEDKKLFDSLLARKMLFIYMRDQKEFIGIPKEYFKYLGPNAAADKTAPVFDFAVLDSGMEAGELMKKNPKIKGVRGFDKRFYLINAERLKDIEAKLEKFLKKEKRISEIAAELKATEDLCRVAIENLKEEGTVIEKKKDLFAWA